jgi:predicted lipoprotein with Yx(FWY)xxD motif
MRKIISVAGLAAAVLAVAACASSTSPSSSAPTSSSSAPAAGSSSSSGTTLKTTTINGTTVLTNSAGFTVYWFAIDTSNKSNCTGSCSTYWPPVKGPATAGSGVTGTLSTITRSDGTTQATYDGHPLYTYVGDTAPGQNKGNGLWYEATPSGTAPATGSSATASSSSGGGGYGY